jgi:7-carboxy-7-deazaguanine synthase
MRFRNPGAKMQLISVQKIPSEIIPKLKVSEIFSSLQGEGPYAGTPAVFLRLAICNMHCWYCDTKYTWLYSERTLSVVKSEIARLHKNTPTDLKLYDLQQEMSELGLDEVKNQLLQSNQNHLVITGGEPMLQQAALLKMLSELKKEKNFMVEVETSGTVPPLRDFADLVDQWNVSPKLEDSGNSRRARENPKALRAFASLPNATFKFVVQAPEDIEEIKALALRYNIPAGRVMLMPEGTSEEALNEKSSWLIKECSESGFQFSTRLHILLWGNERGT